MFIVTHYSYPNPYMSDRLGTEGPILIQATNLVTILVFRGINVPPYVHHFRLSSSLTSSESEL